MNTPIINAKQKAKRLVHIACAIISLLIAPHLLASECVIVLHGLARSANAMEPISEFLEQHHYQVSNIDYPSRDYPIERLSEMAVKQGIESCQAKEAESIFALTHSLGGILIRYYLVQHPEAPIDKVVMLGPPNHGSEVVDNLKNMPGFEAFNGPAGMQLGTDKNSIPTRLSQQSEQLPPLGIIAGTKTFNPILSTYLPNPDDGKVSAQSAQLAGMCSFVMLPTTHTFMMKNDDVMGQVLSFFKTGRFSHPDAQNDLCK
jgi:pimeloyl-ACP methyl ester carboxylesterase